MRMTTRRAIIARLQSTTKTESTRPPRTMPIRRRAIRQMPATRPKRPAASMPSSTATTKAPAAATKQPLHPPSATAGGGPFTSALFLFGRPKVHHKGPQKGPVTRSINRRVRLRVLHESLLRHRSSSSPPRAIRFAIETPFRLIFDRRYTTIPIVRVRHLSVFSTKQAFPAGWRVVSAWQ